ncbi:MAG TPA: orotidine-5'-phosphate decarboxylase [Acidimicrobiales bacterium]|nr:orotidine-5'-phosphate decarboxylase [Acidimicrobiales bacterium]
MAEPGPALRRRLVLALDCAALEAALALARPLVAYFGVAKVGLELFGAVGPAALAPLASLGYEVFLDLKLHDIPTTVGRAARVAGRLGASYLTLHAAGGAAMLEAGVAGLAEGAAASGVPGAALAVTVLTSEGPAPGLAAERAALAARAGCRGVVCAAGDLPGVRAAAPGLLACVPGIRLPGGERHDQARSAAPAEALAAGADLLVVGRAVTQAPDPLAAAEALVAALAS